MSSRQMRQVETQGGDEHELEGTLDMPLSPIAADISDPYTQVAQEEEAASQSTGTGSSSVLARIAGALLVVSLAIGGGLGVAMTIQVQAVAPQGNASFPLGNAVNAHMLVSSLGRWEDYAHYDYPNRADVATSSMATLADVKAVAAYVESHNFGGFSVRGSYAFIKSAVDGPTSMADLTFMGEADPVTFFLFVRNVVGPPMVTTAAQAFQPQAMVQPQSSASSMPANLQASVCNDPGGAKTMYMYRAQDNQDYGLENVNAADIPGVLWYLQNEVVTMCPRKNRIGRIIRYKVTLRPLAPGPQANTYVAFDKMQVTTPTQAAGLVSPGCQGRPYAGIPGHWYSLPGRCPRTWVKAAGCELQDPGGVCDCQQSLGAGSCTYHWEDAGWVDLNLLEGFSSVQEYVQFCLAGGLEYDKDTKKGKGNSFWDGGFDDSKKAAQRVQAVLLAFKSKYPNLPLVLDQESCW